MPCRCLHQEDSVRLQTAWLYRDVASASFLDFCVFSPIFGQHVSDKADEVEQGCFICAIFNSLH